MLKLEQRGETGQIANKLRISESTVKIHVSSILVKLSVNNRTEAVIKFFQEA